MKLDHVGNPIFTSKNLIQEIYNGNLNLISKSQIEYNTDIDYLSYVEFVTENNLNDWPIPQPYFGNIKTVKEVDNIYQNNWNMPNEYYNFDIEKYILDLCDTEEKIQRVNTELVLFKKYNLLILLKFLKFLVDNMRNRDILWGVGRGSSVASYCLYLLGVHKIDSIKYDLDINEFLK